MSLFPLYRRLLESSPAFRLTTGAAAADTLRDQLRVVTVAWFFGSVWMFIIMSAVLNKYLRSLGTPEWGFGIVAATPFIGAVFQLPASYVMERFGRRRLVFLWTLTVSRALWVLAGAIPWVMTWPGAERYWWPMMAVTAATAWALDNMGRPNWMNWMTDVVPDRIRGRYFAFRQKATRPLVIVLLPLVGWVMDIAQAADAGEPGSLMLITSVILMIAGLLGVLDIQCFTRIRDDEGPQGERAAQWLRKLAEPLQDRPFRRYLLYNFMLFLGIGALGQYVYQFVFDVAGVSNVVGMVMLGTIPMLTTMFSYGLWGKMIDRVGRRPVLVIAGALFVLGPYGWFFVTPEHWWIGYSMTIISPLVFPGVEVANLNMLLNRAGKNRRRASRRPGESEERAGSAYAAVHGVVAATGGMASGFAAAGIAGLLEHWTWSTAALPITLTYHHVLFVLSSLCRVVAVVLAIGMVEQGSATISESVRILLHLLWRAVRAAPGWPVRTVRRWLRLLRPRRRPAEALAGVRQ